MIEPGWDLVQFCHCSELLVLEASEGAATSRLVLLLAGGVKDWHPLPPPLLGGNSSFSASCWPVLSSQEAAKQAPTPVPQSR